MVDHAESLLDTIRALGVLRVERQGRHVPVSGRSTRSADRSASRSTGQAGRLAPQAVSLRLSELDDADEPGLRRHHPGRPARHSLTWLKMVVGQFYMAVVVAQLVGLKLAQAISRAGSGAG